MSTAKKFCSLAVVCLLPFVMSSAAQTSPGRTRTYYIAADEVEWDYAPMGANGMTGKPFEGYAKMQTERGPHGLGTKFKKVLYREYTDDTFTKLKPRAPEEAYLGMLGPTLHAEVGDTIKVVFKNNGMHLFSMHPHGVAYEKDSEGALYPGMDPESTGVVPPGKVHTYTWNVLERSGPGPQDPSSVVWLYHSHAHEVKDVDSGLIGTIVISRRGMARPDGTPKDVDREFVALFMAYSEHQSWYIDENIQKHAIDAKTAKKLEVIPIDETGNFTFIGSGLGDTLVKWTMNGFVYGNMPMMHMKRGEHVRWYLVTLGEGFNFHTPHWHGNVVTVAGQRTDVVAISPAQMITADMVPDRAGMWMFHCHVSEHMAAGMMGHYMVE